MSDFLYAIASLMPYYIVLSRNHRPAIGTT